MVRKIALIVLASLFLMPVLAQEAYVSAPGTIWFSGGLIEEQYTLSLHFEQDIYQEGSLKAIKITFEPSGTVTALIYDENCTPEEKKLFLDGKVPLSFMATSSFVRLDPRIYYNPQSNYLADDTTVRIEYLVEKDGEISPVLGAEIAFEDLADADFAVMPQN